MSADCVQNNVYVLTQANAYVFLLKPRDGSRAVQTNLDRPVDNDLFTWESETRAAEKTSHHYPVETAPDVTARAPTQGRHDAYLLKGLSQFHREDELMLQN